MKPAMCTEADQVDLRDTIIRKIFNAGLVQGGRRWVRSGGGLTMEEADVLETIVPLNPPRLANV